MHLSQKKRLNFSGKMQDEHNNLGKPDQVVEDYNHVLCRYIENIDNLENIDREFGKFILEQLGDSVDVEIEYKTFYKEVVKRSGIIHRDNAYITDCITSAVELVNTDFKSLNVKKKLCKRSVPQQWSNIFFIR